MRTALNQWVALDDDQWMRFASIFRERRHAAREHVLLPGENVHELLFVCSGLLRFYYLDENGSESNKAFTGAGTFGAPHAAYLLQQPVIYGIETLEPTALLTAPYADFVALFDADPAFDRLGRKLAEWLLMRKELRALGLLQQDASERYRDFLSQHAPLVERIPQYHIASYLGITDVSLSRIRRAIR